MRFKIEFFSPYFKHTLGIILGIGFAGVWGCNPDATTPNEESTPFDYSTVVSMHPDTNLRPEFQWISSYRLPFSKYGFDFAFDGDSQTYWSTLPGLNHLEGFEWTFEAPVQGAKFRIGWMEGDMFCKPSRILCFSDRGSIEASVNTWISLPDSIRKLKLVFLLDKQWSRVALALNNSPFSSQARVKKGLATLFESKPLGISEIEFIVANKKTAPFKTTDGFVRITEQPSSDERFSLNDGREYSGIVLNSLVKERRIFIQFPDLRAFLGFRVKGQSASPSCVQFVWHKPNGSSQMSYVNTGTVEHKFTIDTVATKNLSFTATLLEGESINLMEFDFWDGAKWYRIQEDSLQFKAHSSKWMRSLPNEWPLNKSIWFDEAWSKSVPEAPDWETERDATITSSSGQWVQALFRGNGTFELLWSSSSNGDSFPYSMYSGSWNWTDSGLKLTGYLWTENGREELNAGYQLQGKRLIPTSTNVPEFEFSY